MLRNKFMPIIMILFTLLSCVKYYMPKIKSSDTNKFVIIGQVTMGTQTQTVNISMTSPINNPAYKPVTGCKVTILDNENHRFPMSDLGNGDYSTLVDPQYLVPGHVFKVNVVTPDGDSIISDYDTLQQVPPIDSISYQIKNIESNIPQQSTQGIQFYIDLNGTSADSRYYRWVIYETWEYHAKYAVTYWWDGTMHENNPPDSSKFTCWDTRKIPEIFTLSTSNLSQNKYNNYPLQYISTNTNKLANGYSMLVEQLALSQSAYNYWYQMKTNSSQEGGLYTKQPISIRGNLHDVTNPDKEVLGFFSAESASYKRIFVPPVHGLTFHYLVACEEHKLLLGFGQIPKSAYPAAIKVGSQGPLPIWLSPICVNCLLSGGTTVKPSFWPK